MMLAKVRSQLSNLEGTFSMFVVKVDSSRICFKSDVIIQRERSKSMSNIYGISFKNPRQTNCGELEVSTKKLN